MTQPENRANLTIYDLELIPKPRLYASDSRGRCYLRSHRDSRGDIALLEDIQQSRIFRLAGLVHAAATGESGGSVRRCLFSVECPALPAAGVSSAGATGPAAVLMTSEFIASVYCVPLP